MLSAGWDKRNKFIRGDIHRPGAGIGDFSEHGACSTYDCSPLRNIQQLGTRWTATAGHSTFQPRNIALDCDI